MLLHETAMAMGAEGLGFGLFFFLFFFLVLPFLAVRHLRRICQWVAIPDRFLRSCSTFYEAPLTPAMGTLLGVAGCSLEQEQPCAGHAGCAGFISET